MIVIASWYALFTVMGAVVAALEAHGVFDLAHRIYFANAGAPIWWPRFCLTYEATAAAYLAWLLRANRIRAAA